MSYFMWLVLFHISFHLLSSSIKEQPNFSMHCWYAGFIIRMSRAPNCRILAWRNTCWMYGLETSALWRSSTGIAMRWWSWLRWTTRTMRSSTPNYVGPRIASIQMRHLLQAKKRWCIFALMTLYVPVVLSTRVRIFPFISLRLFSTLHNFAFPHFPRLTYKVKCVIYLHFIICHYLSFFT